MARTLRLLWLEYRLWWNVDYVEVEVVVVVVVVKVCQGRHGGGVVVRKGV